MTSDQSLSGLLLSMLIAACMLFASGAYAAGAGTVVSTSGSASILSADGKSRKATVDATINQGDKVVTGEKGKIDIRFSDDSVVQVHAQSEFQVDQYNYTGKSDEESKGFFSLLKGGMRTVTGLLSKFNRSAYRVTTPMATIGIRGTEYSARIENGLHVKVERGEISLTNQAGCFPVTEGQVAYMADQKSSPKYLNLGSSAQGGGSGSRSSGASWATQIQGTTKINANVTNVNAIAAGQDNAAANKMGVIGGK